MAVLFPEAPPVRCGTATGADYPVSRIFCIGRNYAAHAREMGKDPERDPPFFFTKWAETLVNAAPEDNASIPYPSKTSNFHFEIELVVAIGKPGRAISRDRALDHVWGYAVGLDMTRRDLQLAARDKGRPWDSGKNVEHSSPIGRLISAADVGHISQGTIALQVNGETKQSANIADLIWSVPELIEEVSAFYALCPGDLVFTGTPAGVGPVVAGDVIDGSVDGLPQLRVAITHPATRGNVS